MNRLLRDLNIFQVIEFGLNSPTAEGFGHGDGNFVSTLFQTQVYLIPKPNRPVKPIVPHLESIIACIQYLAIQIHFTSVRKTKYHLFDLCFIGKYKKTCKNSIRIGCISDILSNI